MFLDSTRNHSRRWCSSGDCGNRARARRHYARSRQTDR
ncbi:MAG: CGNR zinc finger domain-containing protein [Solirubrobacterales bacterium]|nr:CGNR zinc finger domain-containing protein [Solirubrobacterales bacterium]